MMNKVPLVSTAKPWGEGGGGGEEGGGGSVNVGEDVGEGGCMSICISMGM